MLEELRLFQLISPALPIGGFTYSQGLEWAVEEGWVNHADSFAAWLTGILQDSIATLELPVLLRLQQAFSAGDLSAVHHWCNWLLACRETKELRLEERQRGAALAKLLPQLDIAIPEPAAKAIASTQLAGLALAADQWQIAPDKLCIGYSWSWLENYVTAGIKLIPLGQTQGQQLLLQLATLIPTTLSSAKELDDADVGSYTPAVSIASSLHEHQYTRLFRS